MDKSNRSLYAVITRGDIEPIPFSFYGTDYYYYSIQCKTVTIADIDTIESWIYADGINIDYKDQLTADVLKRIDEISVKMPHVKISKS